MSLYIPDRLARHCRVTAAGAAWLEQLPDAVRRLEREWELALEAPFDGAEVRYSWVAPAVQRGATRAVLKLPLPHMEAEHEGAALRFWNGDGAVRVLDADEHSGALLLERCEPGTALRALPEPEQDVVIADLLRRIWRPPSARHPFRTLAAMLAAWTREAEEASARWRDAGLVRAGLQLYAELSLPAAGDVVLATDLHAGNVLAARREPRLVIDPKPFVGERAYDATQHLLNCDARVCAAPEATIRRFAALLGVDAERVRLWTFARAAARVPGQEGESWDALARGLDRLGPLA